MNWERRLELTKILDAKQFQICKSCGTSDRDVEITESPSKIGGLGEVRSICKYCGRKETEEIRL